MLCKRCGAKEYKYFFEGVCRRCIHLRSEFEVEIGEVGESELNLGFELTKYQKAVSDALQAYVEAGHSVYLNAVCGAGKSEMCLTLIASLIDSGLKVGWAIPRTQIVVELGERLTHYFPGLKIACVYGTHTDVLWGDLIVCTTHQLYRYHGYFDVLILDEPDAFPYAGNEMLEYIMRQSVRGPIVYLSATLKEVDVSVKKLSLDLRPSHKMLPQPQCSFSFRELLYYLWIWRHEKVLIFVPSRKFAHRLAFVLRCDALCSDSEDKQDILARFRNRGGFLVCTTVLERGVTFVDCFVIVIKADHRVFTESTLVQIAGRVGRGMNPSKGAVLFWSRYASEVVTLSCLRISKHNESAQSVLKTYV